MRREFEQLESFADEALRETLLAQGLSNAAAEQAVEQRRAERAATYPLAVIIGTVLVVALIGSGNVASRQGWFGVYLIAITALIGLAWLAGCVAVVRHDETKRLTPLLR